MRLFKYALLSVVLTAGLFFYTGAKSQEAEYNAMRISWPANPADQGVEWYILSYFDGTRDAWVKLVDTRETSYTASFSDITADGLKIGDNICFNLVAAKGNERSVPSDRTCVDIPAVNQQPAQPSSLSKPAKAVIDFLTR